MATNSQQLITGPNSNIFIPLPSKKQIANEVKRYAAANEECPSQEDMDKIIKEARVQMMKQYLTEEGVYLYTYINSSRIFKNYEFFSVGRLRPGVINEHEVVGRDNQTIYLASYICVKALFQQPVSGRMHMYTVDLLSGETFLVADIDMQQDEAAKQKEYIQTVIMQRLIEENVRCLNLDPAMISNIILGETGVFMDRVCDIHVDTEMLKEISASSFMRDRSYKYAVTVCVTDDNIEVLPTCIYNPTDSYTIL
jgi:hypothetical protein